MKTTESLRFGLLAGISAAAFFGTIAASNAADATASAHDEPHDNPEAPVLLETIEHDWDTAFDSLEGNELAQALTTTNYTAGGNPYNIRAISSVLGNVELTDSIYKADELDPMLDTRLPSFVVLAKNSTTYSGTVDCPSSAFINGKPFVLYCGSATVANMTIKLTFSDGVVTNAIPYFWGTTRVGAQYSAGWTKTAYARLVSGVMSLCFDADRDTDSHNNLAYNVTYHQQVKAVSAITANSIIVGDANGYKPATVGTSFDIGYPILYSAAAGTAGNNIAAGSVYFQSYNSNCKPGATDLLSPAYTASAAAYLTGTLEGDIFTITGYSYTPTRPCFPLGTFSAAAAASKTFTFHPGSLMLPEVEVPEIDVPKTGRTTGGWRDPYFWLPRVTAASGTSRTYATERTGTGYGLSGDTTFRHAYNDKNEAYILDAVVDPSRYRSSEEPVSVEGVWTIVEDSSGACTLNGNVLSGGGKDAVCVLKFTDLSGKSKTTTVVVGAWSKQELVIQNPWSEYADTFRKAYSDAILQKFAALDWSTGHVFPNFMRFNRDRNYPCYFGKEPWELELYSDYDNWCTTDSKCWGNSTNFTMFTEGVPDSKTKKQGLTYKEALVSYAQGPKTMNSEFFWPALQQKLRCVSGGRADWYAHRTAVKLSDHYLLCATHYNQKSNRFFDSNGVKHDYTATASVVPTDDEGSIGFDWTIMVVADGMPDIPNMEFIGPHGSEDHSSLYNLSPSLLNGAPAIQLTQSDTIALGYLYASGAGGLKMAGLSAPTNEVSYSLRITLPLGWNWINTSYPALNERHPYYNKKCIQLKDGVTFVNHTVTVDDIDYYYDQTPNDDFMLYKGAHYPIAGDSSRPLMGYYNDHLWLYGIFYSPTGGQSALNLRVTKRLDAWIRQDSLQRFGVEEGLTFIDCCTLDPNHAYHSH